MTVGTEAPSMTGRTQALLIWVAGTAFLFGLLGLFYPRATVSVDETRYLSVADYLMRGQVFDRSSEAWFRGPTGDGTGSQRVLYAHSPVFSAVLIPFVAVDWRGAFLLGPVVHVLAFGGMIYVLLRRGLNPAWALLYLLHPTFMLYSRMVMVDVTAAALFVLVLVLLHREQPNYFLAGFVTGFSLLVKLSNFPVVAVLAGVTFVQDLARMRRVNGPGRPGFRWLRMGLGMLPCVAVLLTANAYFFHSPFGSVYLGIPGGMFAWQFFVKHLPFYALALVLLYPLMLLSPLFLRGRLRWEMALSCLAALLFFSAYYFVDEGNSLPERLVRGMRFQLIVMPFYIVAYAEMITGFLRRVGRERLQSAMLAAGAVLLGVAGAAVSYRHYVQSVRDFAVTRKLDEALPGSGTVVVLTKYLSSIAHPGLRVIYLRGEFDLRGLADRWDLPLLLVADTGTTTRTEAHRTTLDNRTQRALEVAGKYFEVREYDHAVEGFEIRILGAKPGQQGHPSDLPPRVLPEKNR